MLISNIKESEKQDNPCCKDCKANQVSPDGWQPLDDKDKEQSSNA